MQFRFELLSVRNGKIHLKCFFGPSPDYVECYLTFDLVSGMAEFVPKEEPLDQVFKLILGSK